MATATRDKVAAAQHCLASFLCDGDAKSLSSNSILYNSHLRLWRRNLEEETDEEEKRLFAPLLRQEEENAEAKEEGRHCGTVVIVLCGSSVLDTVHAAANLWWFYSLRQMSSLPPPSILVTGGVGHSTHFLYDAVRKAVMEQRFSNPKLNNEEAFFRCFSCHHSSNSNNVPAVAEADIFAKLLEHEYNIPHSAILVEKESTNCGANAEMSVPLIMKSLRDLSSSSTTSSLKNSKEVLLIQDPTMQRRSRMSFEKHLASAASFSRNDKEETKNNDSANITVVNVKSVSCPFGACGRAEAPYDSERYLSLLLGEIPRLRPEGYGPLGKNFIGHCDIGRDVEDAFKVLSEFVEGGGGEKGCVGVDANSRKL